MKGTDIPMNTIDIIARAPAGKTLRIAAADLAAQAASLAEIVHQSAEEAGAEREAPARRTAATATAPSPFGFD